MLQNFMKIVYAIVLILASATVFSEEEILQPDSWTFPEVVESARKINSKNLEGIVFNQFGLAYTKDQLAELDVSIMRPEQLQNYADIVTHAYPDAVGKQIPCNCSSIPLDSFNETTIAGIAHVSLNAKNENIRSCAKACLIIIQGSIQELE